MKSGFLFILLVVLTLGLMGCPSKPVKESPYNDAESQRERAKEAFKGLEREVDK